ncbi:MAG: hypothetical protein ACRD43_06345 [Pyrinomonadaceae bacterium]
MKKIVGIAIFVFICFLVRGASAQTRIQFEKGKNSAVVKGSTGTDGVYYVVRAKSGQKIVLTLAPASTVGIKVETEGSDGHQVLLREQRGGTYEIGLEADGDYTIFLGSTNHRSVPYTLTVKITKLADV